MMATAAAILYTTASDALVSPKLKFGASEQTVLQGYLRSSYANPNFVRVSCATPISNATDPSGGNSCLDVRYSGDCKTCSPFRPRIRRHASCVCC